MSQPVGKAAMKETNNFKSGKSGSKVPMMTGPAVGHGAKNKNPTSGGGINRATKSKS